MRESKRGSRAEARAGKSGSGPDVGQDGLVPSRETVMARGEHAHGAKREGGLSWETETPGNVEITGTQHVVGVDSDEPWESWCWKNDVLSGTTTVGGEIRGVTKYQGLRLQDLLHNGQKRCIGCHERPIWKKLNQMLESSARRSGMLVWSCETRWTEAASVRQNWMRVSEAMPACGK